MVKQLLLLVLLALATGVDAARTWTDKTGAYTIEADLIGFTDDSVILQRADKELAKVGVEHLSEADRQFLTSEEARIATKEISSQQQTWSTRSGITVIGQVVDYVSKDVTFERKRGRVYVNDRVFDNLPEVYQRIAPKIVAHFEQNQVQDKKTLESWLVHRKGAPAKYRVDGVIIALENGDEYGVPFFLLSDQDLSVLQPGWDEWAAAHQQNDHETRSDLSYELQSLAAARQADAQVDRQIAQLQLGMQAITAGVTSLWEVTLYPGPGVNGPPLWVPAPGRDSRQATAFALQQNPGYVAGPVRRVSR